MTTAASLLEGSTVLDVGCGVGHLYPFVKPLVSEYLGVDTSDEMLKFAKQFFPGVRFEHGDVYDLSPLGVFDTVYCLSTMIHLPEIEAPIRELWKHVGRALVFNIPIEKKRVIKKRPYKNGYLIYHGESWENILEAVNKLDNVEAVERHNAPPTITSRLYVKVLKAHARP